MEFSIENISFIRDVRKFQKKLISANDVYYKYLNGIQSVMEVNITRNVANRVLEKMKTGYEDEDLFEEVEKQVIANLCDTYTRFVYFGPYVEYLKNQKLEKELIEGK